MKTISIHDAPYCLNMNDKAFWVFGYNDAVKEHEAELAALQAQPVQEPETFTKEELLKMASDTVYLLRLQNAKLADDLAASTALQAQPVQHLSESDTARVEWCISVLEDVKTLGRDNTLGDSWPHVVMVIGALKRVLQPNLPDHAQPVQPAADPRTLMDVTIDDDEALKFLRDMVAPPLLDGELTPVRILLGDGHSGYGLYVAAAEYQDQGAWLLASVAAPVAQPVQEPARRKGYVLVPIHPTRAMEQVFQEEDWEWAEVLAAAEAVTEEEYVEAIEHVPPVQPVQEPQVRYCPDCGSIGPVPATARDCCPDGQHARMVPENFAKSCRETFLRAIREPQPVKQAPIKSFKELDYKVGWQRYEKVRKLNVHQFSELFQRGLQGERFDEMVDGLGAKP